MRTVHLLKVPSRLLVLVPLLGFLACSETKPKIFPVTGTLLYKDQPATGAMVAFYPKNDSNQPASVGVVAKDGTFSLSTGRDEGAPAGEYVVTVSWIQEVKTPQKGNQINMSMNEGGVPVDRLKGAYSDKSKSTLMREIKPGPNQLEPILLK
jgi:hypothetical protein